MSKARFAASYGSISDCQGFVRGRAVHGLGSKSANGEPAQSPREVCAKVPAAVFGARLSPCWHSTCPLWPDPRVLRSRNSTCRQLHSRHSVSLTGATLEHIGGRHVMTIHWKIIDSTTGHCGSSHFYAQGKRTSFPFLPQFLRDAVSNVVYTPSTLSLTATHSLSLPQPRLLHGDTFRDETGGLH